MPPMFGTVLQAGDVMHHRMAGGGGHGDPRARDPLAVARDVADDKVSVAAARDVYGVVVGHDGEVDLEATDELRRSVVR
jgi:N-methylhydantoinase B